MGVIRIKAMLNAGCEIKDFAFYTSIQNRLISEQRKICKARILHGDKVGSLPELCSNPELLQNTPSIDMDTNGAAIYSQSLRLLQHKARNPFPGCKSAADCIVVGMAATPTSEIAT